MGSLFLPSYESWKTGNIQTYISNTRADGLATNFGYELTQQIMKQYLDDFLLVSEEDMINAVFLYLKETRNLAEYAGSASLAAAINIKDVLVGKKTGEGVVGVSFKMKGPPKDIKTTVNPIKTLTPRFIVRAVEKMKKNEKDKAK